MIQYIPENTALPPIRKQKISKWIKNTAAGYGKTCGDIAFIFCNDDKILEINRQYLDHDYYTDIITFDYTQNDLISGDIFISTDTVKSNSETYHTDYQEEIHRIIIHGILHLCGQDDKTPEARELMTAKENRALEVLMSMPA